MKRVMVVSILLNVILAGWMFLSRTPQANPSPSAPSSKNAPQRISRTPEQKKPVPAASRTAPAATKQFDWRQVESEDYQQYMANLRAIGCPEKTIRDIIVADINELFEAHRAAILSTNDQFWSQGSSSSENEQAKQTLALYLKKLEVLKSLGIDEPDFANLLWENFRADFDNKWNCNFLSESQQQRFNQVLFSQAIKEVILKVRGDHQTGFEEEVRANLQALLTPEEFKEYELRTSADADTLRSQLAGAQVTEAEYRTIFDWTRSLKESLSQVAADSEQYRQAELATNAAIRELLGPERFQRCVLGAEISGYKLTPVK